MAETVLVTGGTGYVARWCIAELRDRGFSVRTTVRSRGRTGAVAADEIAVADLTRDDGWDAAVAGCDYVLHVASPLGADGRAQPDALIDAARDGTMRVLRAAKAAGVKRVGMTSSTAASTPTRTTPGAVADETLWTDPAHPDLTPYRRSKILAERAAWDFIEGRPESTTLTTILPAAVFGPVRSPENVGSVDVIARLL